MAAGMEGMIVTAAETMAMAMVVVVMVGVMVLA